RLLWVLVASGALACAFGLGFFSGQRQSQLAELARQQRTLQELDASRTATQPLAFYQALTAPLPPTQPRAGAAQPPRPAARPPVVAGPAAEAAGDAEPGFTLQVGAWRAEAEAEAVVSRLRRRGLSATIQRAPQGRGVWYRVRLGHYRSKEAAQKALPGLRAADVEAMVVRLP
ncbi:MAG: SPOR domain-containing protein, partial [Deltaproteobacteria bacterium]